MSHITTVSTEFRELEVLREALGRLGLAFSETDAVVYDYYRRTTSVDLAVRLDGDWRMGFRRNGDTFDLIGDPYGQRSRWDETSKAIRRTYAEIMATKQMRLRGYSVTKTIHEDGTIELIARRWAG